MCVLTLPLPRAGADAMRELLQLSGSSDWECACPFGSPCTFFPHCFFRYYQDSNDVAVFTMPPREGIPYRSVMGRGNITSAGGLAAFLPLINGVANISKWDDKFQQVLPPTFCPRSCPATPPSQPPSPPPPPKGRELEKLSERQSIYYAAYSSGTAQCPPLLPCPQPLSN